METTARLLRGFETPTLQFRGSLCGACEEHVGGAKTSTSHHPHGAFGQQPQPNQVLAGRPHWEADLTISLAFQGLVGSCWGLAWGLGCVSLHSDGDGPSTKGCACQVWTNQQNQVGRGSGVVGVHHRGCLGTLQFRGWGCHVCSVPCLVYGLLVDPCNHGGEWKGPLKVRCGPAPRLQPRLPSHGLHRLVSAPHDTLRNVLLQECLESLSPLEWEGKGWRGGGGGGGGGGSAVLWVRAGCPTAHHCCCCPTVTVR